VKSRPGMNVKEFQVPLNKEAVKTLSHSSLILGEKCKISKLGQIVVHGSKTCHTVVMSWVLFN